MVCQGPSKQTMNNEWLRSCPVQEKDGHDTTKKKREPSERRRSGGGTQDTEGFVVPNNLEDGERNAFVIEERKISSKVVRVDLTSNFIWL